MQNSSLAVSNTRLVHRQLQADFVIIGGGMAGICAALAAARNGITVVLVQDRSVLGGNASSEIKMHIVGADCHGHRPGARESGIIEELRLEDAYRNPHRSYSQWDLLLYEKVKAEPNITLLLDADCISCSTNDVDGAILSVTVLRNLTEEVFTITGRFFADCSGDSRLGAEAGADYRVGRESQSEYGEAFAPLEFDAKTLGNSILFTARKYENPQEFKAPSWVRKFERDQLKYRPVYSFEYGYWWFEWGGHLDTIKDIEPIRHELLRIALGAWDYVKNSGEHPDSANWALDWVGIIPGKRESRRLLGPYVLTQQDVQRGHVFEDSVAYGGWPIDLHPVMGVDATDEYPCTQTEVKELYGIPFRCLYSRNIPNLLFAGRNISASHVAFASTRVMATCSVVGQAIGTAAAIACQKAIDLGDFIKGPGIEALQQQLLRDDAFIPSHSNRDEADKARTETKIVASCEVKGGEAHRIVDGITRDLPKGFGNWSDGKQHHWTSVKLPAWIEVQFSGPKDIQEIHLTFDSGFERELLLTLSDHMSAKTVRGAQPELVQSYRILADDKVLIAEDDNYLRKRVHKLNESVKASRLRIEVLATHGAAQAKIFEVRVY